MESKSIELNEKHVSLENNLLTKAMAYIAQAVIMHQVIDEVKIKALCKNAVKGVNDQICEVALNNLHKGLVITHREKGYAYQTLSLHNKMNLDGVISKFKRLTQ